MTTNTENDTSESDPDYGYEDVRNILSGRDLEFVDKTDKGGAIYFFDEQTAEFLKAKGYIVHFAKNGTKGTKGQAAWYIKL